MVLYTDGVTRTKDGKGEEFGYERLAKLVNEVTEFASIKIQNHLINKLYEFRGRQY